MSDPLSSHEEFEKLLANLPQGQADRVRELLERYVESAVKDLFPAVFRNIVRTIGYSDDVASRVRELAEEYGEDAVTLLNKALNLYSAALAASSQGNRLAILSPSDEIIRDIVGIGSPGVATMSISG